MPKRALKKTPAKKVALVHRKKVYADFRDVQMNAPRKLGNVVSTKAGVDYEFTNELPPVWKKK